MRNHILLGAPLSMNHEIATITKALVVWASMWAWSSTSTATESGPTFMRRPQIGDPNRQISYFLSFSRPSLAAIAKHSATKVRPLMLCESKLKDKDEGSMPTSEIEKTMLIIWMVSPLAKKISLARIRGHLPNRRETQICRIALGPWAAPIEPPHSRGHCATQLPISKRICVKPPGLESS